MQSTFKKAVSNIIKVLLSNPKMAIYPRYFFDSFDRIKRCYLPKNLDNGIQLYINSQLQ